MGLVGSAVDPLDGALVVAAGFLPPPPDAIDNPDHWYWDALARERAKATVRSQMVPGWIAVSIAVLVAVVALAAWMYLI